MIGMGTGRVGRRMRAAPVVLAAVAALTGCELLSRLLPPGVTRVALRNDGDFAVDVVLFIGSQQDVPEEVLKAVGEKLEFSIPPGERREFSRDCDELQALVVDEAELNVIGEIGPKTDTDVLRDGTHFRCGSTIEFTFDHSALITDFRVETRVRDPGAPEAR